MGSWCHWWAPLPGGELWERLLKPLPSPKPLLFGAAVSALSDRLWGNLGWVDAGCCCGGPGFDSQPGPGIPVLWGRTGLLSVLRPAVPALSDGGKSLKSPRDQGFGHVALVLPYFREHLFSETPTLSGAASLLPGECFKVQAGLARAR